jgi:hypothetical protein
MENNEIEYVFEKGNDPAIYIDMSVFSDEKDFEPSELTEKLRIQPTATWHKGDTIRQNLYRKETCWHLKTKRMITFDFNDVFVELMAVLNGKVDILQDYVEENNLCVKIYPVIVISDTMPSIIIGPEIQKILLSLNATLEFDMYFA